MVVRSLSVLVAFASLAHAAEAPAPKAPPTHERGGLAIGVTGGFAVGTASGYPNDLQKIDDPMYFGAGGTMVGESSGAMVMGAFARELSFGVWVNQSATTNPDGKWRSSGYGGGFRLEVFPLGWLWRPLRDLGFIGQFGVGAANLRANQGTYPGAEGVQSYVGTGVFYEWLVARPNILKGRTRWALGPSLEYQLITSRPFERSTMMLGLRFVFYTGR